MARLSHGERPRTTETTWRPMIPPEAIRPEVGAIALAVYVVLAQHADSRTGTCWPSYAHIAAQIGISRRQAMRMVTKLESLGLVTIAKRRVVEGDADSNLYTLPHLVRGVVTDVHHLVTDVHQGGDSGSLGVVTDVHPNKNHVEPEPLNQSPPSPPERATTPPRLATTGRGWWRTSRNSTTPTGRAGY